MELSVLRAERRPGITRSRPDAERAARVRCGRRCIAVLVAAVALASRAAHAQVLQTVTDGVGGVDGLAGVKHIAISPDGAHLYAAADTDSAVSVFAIGPTGLLTFVQALKDDWVGGPSDGLRNARYLQVSPDGANVYVAAYNEFATASFSRNPATGALALVNEVPNPPCCSAFTSINEVVVSPDGQHVYTVSNGYAVALARGFGGSISLIDQYDLNDDTFGRGFAVAVSPDGAHLYIAHDIYLEAVTRQSGGALAFAAQYEDGIGGIDGLNGVESITISPDGFDVYAGSVNDHAVTHFTRSPATGQLSFQTAYVDLSQCAHVNELLMLADGSGLVASCLEHVAFYERDPATGALFLSASIPQESIGASQIYSAAVSGGVLYLASNQTNSIVVLPAPAAAPAVPDLTAAAWLIGFAGIAGVAIWNLGARSRRRPGSRATA